MTGTLTRKAGKVAAGVVVLALPHADQRGHCQVVFNGVAAGTVPVSQVMPTGWVVRGRHIIKVTIPHQPTKVIVEPERIIARGLDYHEACRMRNDLAGTYQDIKLTTV